MSKTREKYPLDESKPIKKTVSSSLGLVLMVFGFLVGGFFVNSYAMQLSPDFPTSWINMGLIGLFVLMVVYIVFTFIYQKLYFNSYYYDLNEHFIVIRKGVLTPTEISIPYERVQDVYVDQDIWDRIFGLYDVHLSTATVTSGMEAHIDGVNRQVADGLRELLLHTISSKIHRKPTTNSSDDGTK